MRVPVAAVASVVPPIRPDRLGQPANRDWHPICGDGVARSGVGSLRTACACPPSPSGLEHSNVAAMVTNHRWPGPPPAPPTWEAANTSFGDAAANEYAVAMWIQQRALRSQAQVLLFPESVVPMWTVATELFWQATFHELQSSGKTIVLGAGLPRKTAGEPVVDIAASLDVLRGRRQPFATVLSAPTELRSAPGLAGTTGHDPKSSAPGGYCQ